MAHKRTDIRTALVSLLKGTAPGYATDADQRVFANRTHNLNQLPAIVIYDEQETASPRDLRSTQYIRTINTKIEITVEATTSYDSALDDICKQVEDLISADRSITGTASTSVYINTELIFDGSGEKPVGKATLHYEIKYLS